MVACTENSIFSVDASCHQTLVTGSRWRWRLFKREATTLHLKGIHFQILSFHAGPFLESKSFFLLLLFHSPLLSFKDRQVPPPSITSVQRMPCSIKPPAATGKQFKVLIGRSLLHWSVRPTKEHSSVQPSQDFYQGKGCQLKWGCFGPGYESLKSAIWYGQRK